MSNQSFCHVQNLGEGEGGMQQLSVSYSPGTPVEVVLATVRGAYANAVKKAEASRPEHLRLVDTDRHQHGL